MYQEWTYKQSSKQINEKKAVVAGDSMLNGISEKGLSKSQNVTVEDVSGGTSNTGKSR